MFDRNETPPARMARRREAAGRMLLAAAAILGAVALAAILDGELSLQQMGWLVATCTLAGGWCIERSAHMFGRAADARKGAATEARGAEVFETLRPLGWEIYYNVPVPGLGGDVDKLLIAPGRAPRLMVIVEEKTSRYSARDLQRTRQAAAILAGHGPRAAVLTTLSRRETVVREGIPICNLYRAPSIVCALSRQAAAQAA